MNVVYNWHGNLRECDYKLFQVAAAQWKLRYPDSFIAFYVTQDTEIQIRKYLQKGFSTFWDKIVVCQNVDKWDLYTYDSFRYVVMQLQDEPAFFVDEDIILLGDVPDCSDSDVVVFEGGYNDSKLMKDKEKILELLSKDLLGEDYCRYFSGFYANCGCMYASQATAYIIGSETLRFHRKHLEEFYHEFYSSGILDLACKKYRIEHVFREFPHAHLCGNYFDGTGTLILPQRRDLLRSKNFEQFYRFGIGNILSESDIKAMEFDFRVQSTVV